MVRSTNRYPKRCGSLTLYAVNDNGRPSADLSDNLMIFFGVVMLAVVIALALLMATMDAKAMSDCQAGASASFDTCHSAIVG